MRSSLVHWEGAAALSFFMFWMDLYVWSVVSVGTDCSSIGVGVFGMYSVGLGGCRARSFVIVCWFAGAGSVLSVRSVMALDTLLLRTR